MTAKTVRLGVVMLAGLFLLGGCTWGRRTTALPPRQQERNPALTVDLQTLKAENDALRKQQKEHEAKLDELRQLLAQEQAKQKRFREAMTTNFDLLEQSVALTLSKGIGSVNVVQGDKPKGAHRIAAPKPSPKPAAKARPGRRKSPAGPVVAPAPLDSPPVDAPPSSSAGPTVRAAMQTPAPSAAAASAEPVVAGAMPKDDPDLKAPANPRHLTAHPEAKPLYEKGFSLFATRKYDEAVIVFENFLKRFPDDIYSDNAQFWIGESYLRLNRPADAEAAYRKVLRNYEHRPTLEGYKTPDAMLRIAQTYEKRDDARKARYYFEAVVQRFPGTSAGRKAQHELDTLVANTAAN